MKTIPPSFSRSFRRPIPKTRCHAYESQMQDFWLVLFKDVLSFIKRNCHKRLICLLGALFLAFVQPVSLAVAAVPQPPIPTKPYYLKQYAPQTPIEAPVIDLIPQAVYVPPPPPKVCSSGFTTGNYYEDLVIQRESGGKSCVLNSIGACGLFQALPCSKLGCALTDVDCQLAWGTSYMLANYGSWAAAWAHEVNFNWW